jgi:benzoyl-CoA reductase/2-hydroxyglutaryl-CoA dehydratase subunit BcrC/BadD/HgdB
MSAVGYCSPFVPAEWIAAHGLQPQFLRFRPTEKLTRGVCPYVGALLEAASIATWPDVSALVLTTACDQMRYAAAMLEQRGGSPVFLLNVPSTWQTPAARKLYHDEIQRLGRFLVELGGRAPSDAELSRIMLEREQQTNSRGPTARGDATGIALAILGGPLMETDSEFFRLVEHAGGRIALDATENAARTLPRPFDTARIAADPVAELADAYFDGIPDAFRRPNSELYEWLARELAARQIRGIILRRYVWCDLWHAESQRLKEWSSTPVLEIDVGPDDLVAPNRVQGRIEAFLEMLRASTGTDVVGGEDSAKPITSCRQLPPSPLPCERLR